MQLETLTTPAPSELGMFFSASRYMAFDFSMHFSARVLQMQSSSYLHDWVFTLRSLMGRAAGTPVEGQQCEAAKEAFSAWLKVCPLPQPVSQGDACHIVALYIWLAVSYLPHLMLALTCLPACGLPQPTGILSFCLPAKQLHCLAYSLACSTFT